MTEKHFKKCSTFLAIIVCIEEGYWFLWVPFVFSHCAESVYLLWEFSSGISGSLMCAIISSSNKDTLTSFLPICFLLISFGCLIALWLQVLYWIGVERVNNLVLFLILVELFWVSLCLNWCWVWSCCKLPYIVVCPLYP